MKKRDYTSARSERTEKWLEKKQIEYLYGLAFRLFLAILLAINSLILFYFIFTPLTIYPSYVLTKIFYPIKIEGNLFFYADYVIGLINACIAGSAYYLLALLNLTTKSISIATRIKAFLFGALAFLGLNIFRIVTLILILFGFGKFTFNQIHLSFWVIGSTVFVVGVWIATTRMFKIKEVPIYSDFMEVLKIMKNAKKKR